MKKIFGVLILILAIATSYFAFEKLKTTELAPKTESQKKMDGPQTDNQATSTTLPKKSIKKDVGKRKNESTQQEVMDMEEEIDPDAVNLEGENLRLSTELYDQIVKKGKKTEKEKPIPVVFSKTRVGTLMNQITLEVMNRGAENVRTNMDSLRFDVAAVIKEFENAKKMGREVEMFWIRFFASIDQEENWPLLTPVLHKELDKVLAGTKNDYSAKEMDQILLIYTLGKRGEDLTEETRLQLNQWLRKLRNSTYQSILKNYLESL